MLVEEAVFDLEEFVPEDLHSRHEQLQLLSSTITPLFHGGRALPVRLIGPSGAGKTATARYMLRDLERNGPPDLQTAYVDAWRQRTVSRTLYEVLSAVAPQTTEYPHSQTGDLLAAIDGSLDAPTVVVIDEVDMLDEKHVLLDLQENEELALVLVTTAGDWLEDAGASVRSSLRMGRKIPYEPYTVAELVEILEPRAEMGLWRRLSKGELERIAGSVEGDARTAIKTLEYTAREAGTRDTIRDAHIETAARKAKRWVRQKASERLRSHERVLYDVLREYGTLGMDALYEAYCVRVSELGIGDARSRRTCRRYLSKMADYNLIKWDGQTSGREYSIVETPE